MRTASAAAEMDPTPTPPASDVQLTTRERTKRALARRLEERDTARSTAGRDVGDLYSGDTEAELRAMAAGTHPFQRPGLCTPEDLERSMRGAADTLAHPPRPIADE